MEGTWYQRLWRSIKDEAVSHGRPRMSLYMILLLMPIVYTILFGYTYYKNVLNNIPVVVCDMDQTYISRMLITNYDTSDKFDVVSEVTSEDEMLQELRDGKAIVGIYAPPHMTRDIKMGIIPHVGIYINATNIVFGSAAFVGAEEINMNLYIAGGQKIAERLYDYPQQALKAAYPMLIRVRTLNNPTSAYTYFMLLGLVCNGIQISIYLYATAAFTRSKKHLAIWKKNGAFLTLLGKFLVIWCCSFIAYGISFVIAANLFYVPFRAPWYEFAALCGAFVAFFASLSLAFSLCLPGAVIALQGTLLFIMPGLLYSGLSWPGEWMQKLPSILSACFPITYVAIPLRDLSLQGFSILFRHDLTVMLCATTVLLVLDYAVLRFHLHRAAAAAQAATIERTVTV